MPTVGVPLGPGGGGPLLHGLRLGDRRRRPTSVLQILPRAAVDVRLPAQLGRPLKVALAVGRVAPIGQAAAVDPFGPARLLQRPIRRLLPRLAGLVQPIPGLGRPALARPATLRSRGVVRLVGGLRLALVEGERIGQPLPGAHSFGERASELAPQGELDLAVEPPVGALMRVRRLPVGVRVVLRPRGHVAVLYMLAFIAVRGIAPLALDVLILVPHTNVCTIQPQQVGRAVGRGCGCARAS